MIEMSGLRADGINRTRKEADTLGKPVKLDLVFSDSQLIDWSSGLNSTQYLNAAFGV
jgi:hypothetical protein